MAEIELIHILNSLRRWDGSAWFNLFLFMPLSVYLLISCMVGWAQLEGKRPRKRLFSSLKGPKTLTLISSIGGIDPGWNFFHVKTVFLSISISSWISCSRDSTYVRMLKTWIKTYHFLSSIMAAVAVEGCFKVLRSSQPRLSTRELHTFRQSFDPIFQVRRDSFSLTSFSPMDFFSLFFAKQCVPKILRFQGG